MSITKRFTRAGLAVLAGTTALALAACGGGNGNTATTTGTAEGGSDGNVSGSIEVWDYLGQGVSNDAMVAVIEAFNEKYPDIQVNRTSYAFADLSTAIVQGGVAGSVPDVAIVDVVDNQNFAALGLLADITSYYPDGEATFHPGPWSSTQVDGTTRGIPLNSNNLALYYNLDKFEAAGLEAPTTWAELTETATALSGNGEFGIAMSAIKNEQGTFQFLPFLWQTGGDLDTFATDGATALEYLKSLVDAGAMSSAVANYSQEDARTQFVTEKVAMMINGPWELQNLKEAGINFGVTFLPMDAEYGTGLGGENVVQFDGAKNPEAARLFVEFLTSAEGAEIYCNTSGQLSARVDLAGQLELSSDPNMKVFEDQLQYAHARAYGGEYPEISAAIQDALQRVLTGAADPQSAAESAAATITPLLPEN